MKISKVVLKALLLIAVGGSPFAASGATFTDNFDGYTAGSQIHGQGGWKGWDNTPGAGAVVSNAFSASPLNSLNISGGSDLIQTFTGATSGTWTFSALQYVPTGATGDTYIILMNQYNDGGPYSWSVQTHMNTVTNLVISDYAGGITLPVIRDQWVPYRADINLDTNMVSEYYNNQLLITHQWRDTADANSLNAITALDLFANGASSVYYDDVSLVPEASSATLLAMCATGLFSVRRRRLLA